MKARATWCTVLLTGCDSGIGRGPARAFAETGDEVTICGCCAEVVIARYGVSREKADPILNQDNPVGHMITVEEVATAVVYLLSLAAVMVSGHTLMSSVRAI